MKNIVLITRPEDSAAETAYAINQKGYLTFCEPFLEVVYHDVELPELSPYSALIFTSANAVQGFVRNSQRRDIVAYCVGDQTAQAVRQAGFKGYKSAKGNVDDLVKLIHQEPIQGKILYLRARDVAQPLKVKEKNIAEITLYHTEKSKEISQNCLDLMAAGAFSHVLFYSARTAETFTELVEKHHKKQGVKNGLKQCKALCLGDSMIKYVTNLQWKDVVVAKTPDRLGMLHLLENQNE